jgi:CRISPR/Cas system-associated exonuclease Cas4 (RecB family)
MRLGSIAHKMLERAATPSAPMLEALGLPDLDGVFQCREWQELVSAGPERELPFIMHVGVEGKDCWVRGRMDAAVVPDDNGGIPRVIDYKYARWREGGEEAYDLQMTAYALALMKALDSSRAIAELWYLKSPMKIVRREYTRTEAEEKLRGLLSKYAVAVEHNEWPAAERAYCDRIECGFRERCWSET